MALSKKDFRKEALRLRSLSGSNRSRQKSTVIRIFKASNPRFSETRFNNFVKFGTESKIEIARLKKKR